MDKPFYVGMALVALYPGVLWLAALAARGVRVRAASIAREILEHPDCDARLRQQIDMGLVRMLDPTVGIREVFVLPLWFFIRIYKIFSSKGGGAVSEALERKFTEFKHCVVLSWFAANPAAMSLLFFETLMVIPFLKTLEFCAVAIRGKNRISVDGFDAIFWGWHRPRHG